MLKSNTLEFIWIIGSVSYLTPGETNYDIQGQSAWQIWGAESRQYIPPHVQVYGNGVSAIYLFLLIVSIRSTNVWYLNRSHFVWNLFCLSSALISNTNSMHGSRSALAQVMMACCLMAPGHYLSHYWLSGSTLAQVMACCLVTPSHYLNQSSFIIMVHFYGLFIPHSHMWCSCLHVKLKVPF